MTIMNQPITETFTEDEMAHVIVALEVTLVMLDGVERQRPLSYDEKMQKQGAETLSERLREKYFKPCQTSVYHPYLV